MDTLDEYRNILERILEAHHRIPFSHGQIESKFIVDRDRNHFLLMNAGWDGKRRVHGCVVHVEIIGNKIWIHRDGIEDGITDELVAAGVPKNKIVLGFHAPEVRQYTGYAIA
ncbi:XisI protein [Lusitaniella coriacea LEGE 07157]|uniref:XisI protein n=1 Tax=Lusitaniella coriacea LEGE 07157 TaxID=945747 RepID=A0A8J7AW04_9CYAN|nr:XisI protein [Lusitaniella coriacea]MBE9114327.1 XisI protein [Lusitaniella coriacea LEGE 07157]